MLCTVYYCSTNPLHQLCMKKFLLLPFILAATTCMAQLTVATYNIRNSNAADGPNNWELRRDTLVALVKQINPDILGTQEVLKDQLKYLTTTLTGYTAFGAGRNNGHHAGEHSAIFFKKDKFEILSYIGVGRAWGYIKEVPIESGQTRRRNDYKLNVVSLSMEAAYNNDFIDTKIGHSMHIGQGDSAQTNAKVVWPYSTYYLSFSKMIGPAK